MGANRGDAGTSWPAHIIINHSPSQGTEARHSCGPMVAQASIGPYFLYLFVGSQDLSFTSAVASLSNTKGGSDKGGVLKKCFQPNILELSNPQWIWALGWHWQCGLCTHHSSFSPPFWCERQGANSLWQRQWRPKNPGRPIFGAGANDSEMRVANWINARSAGIYLVTRATMVEGQCGLSHQSGNMEKHTLYIPTIPTIDLIIYR